MTRSKNRLKVTSIEELDFTDPIIEHFLQQEFPAPNGVMCKCTEFQADRIAKIFTDTVYDLMWLDANPRGDALEILQKCIDIAKGVKDGTN